MFISDPLFTGTNQSAGMVTQCGRLCTVFQEFHASAKLMRALVASNHRSINFVPFAPVWYLRGKSVATLPSGRTLMSQLTIEDWDAAGNTKQLVELPADAQVNRVITVLVDRMNPARPRPGRAVDERQVPSQGQRASIAR